MKTLKQEELPASIFLKDGKYVMTRGEVLEHSKVVFKNVDALFPAAEAIITEYWNILRKHLGALLVHQENEFRRGLSWKATLLRRGRRATDMQMMRCFDCFTEVQLRAENFENWTRATINELKEGDKDQVKAWGPKRWTSAADEILPFMKGFLMDARAQPVSFFVEG